MTLYIDTREKGLPLANYLSSTLGTKAIFKTLDAGDFLIPVENGANKGKNIIIERSTITDFLGKKKTDRLSFQIDKMEELTDEIYFLIEQPFKLKYTKWNTKAAMGLMLKVQKKYTILMSLDLQWSASYVLLLHDWYGEDRELSTMEYRVRHKTRKDMTPSETAHFMLMGVEGIGDVTARKALEQYSIARLSVMTFEELKEVFANATIADRVFQALNSKI